MSAGEAQDLFDEKFREFIRSESSNAEVPRIKPGMSHAAIRAVLNTPYSIEGAFAKFLLQPTQQATFNEKFKEFLQSQTGMSSGSMEAAFTKFLHQPTPISYSPETKLAPISYSEFLKTKIKSTPPAVDVRTARAGEDTTQWARYKLPNKKDA